MQSFGGPFHSKITLAGTGLIVMYLALWITTALSLFKEDAAFFIHRHRT